MVREVTNRVRSRRLYDLRSGERPTSPGYLTSYCPQSVMSSERCTGSDGTRAEVKTRCTDRIIRTWRYNARHLLGGLSPSGTSFFHFSVPCLSQSPLLARPAPLSSLSSSPTGRRSRSESSLWQGKCPKMSSRRRENRRLGCIGGAH